MRVVSCEDLLRGARHALNGETPTQPATAHAHAKPSCWSIGDWSCCSIAPKRRGDASEVHDAIGRERCVPLLASRREWCRLKCHRDGVMGQSASLKSMPPQSNKP